MSLNIKVRDTNDCETTICVNPNMTIGNAKKLFFGDIRKTHLKFNCEYLYNDKTFSDYGIKVGRRFILLVPEVRGDAGFGLCTIDVEKNNTRIIELDCNAPPYRSIGYGLSAQAICENDCVLKNQIIYTTLGFITNYNILTLNDVGFYDDIVEDGKDFYENALIKAKTVYNFLKSISFFRINI